MAENEPAGQGGGIQIPKALFAAFASLLVAVSVGVTVRIIDLTVDLNGAEIRMAHQQRVLDPSGCRQITYDE